MHRYLVAVLLSGTISTSANAQYKAKQAPLIIQQQGSFLIGGTATAESGKFDLANPLKPQGQTFHGDHAYVFYQIPAKARHLSGARKTD